MLQDVQEDARRAINNRVDAETIKSKEVTSRYLMLFGLVQKRHHLRVLQGLRTKGPQRFNGLKTSTGLEAAQLSRALESLMSGLLVVGRTLPTTGERIPIEYAISKRAERLMAIWDQIHALVHNQSGPEARSIDAEMEALVA